MKSKRKYKIRESDWVITKDGGPSRKFINLLKDVIKNNARIERVDKKREIDSIHFQLSKKMRNYYLRPEIIKINLKENILLADINSFSKDKFGSREIMFVELANNLPHIYIYWEENLAYGLKKLKQTKRDIVDITKPKKKKTVKKTKTTKPTKKTKKIKHNYKYRIISKKEWAETPKDYKGLIDGVKYIMVLDKKKGTILAPVKIKN